MDKHDTPDYGTPSSFVTFRLARLQSSLNAQAIAILKSQSGLSLVEWRLIQTLRMFKRASLTEIATHVQMDKGQLSRKIKTMIAKDLLRVETDQQDQRVQHLHLTEAAEAISKQMMPIMEARQNRLLAEVSPQNLKVFYNVIEKIEAASKVRDIE
ncbi:MAG: MarR family winged helix-turn-helix transcriptional regulator [Pseudomonadota bacterium]